MLVNFPKQIAFEGKRADFCEPSGKDFVRKILRQKWLNLYF